MRSTHDYCSGGAREKLPLECSIRDGLRQRADHPRGCVRLFCRFCSIPERTQCRRLCCANAPEHRAIGHFLGNAEHIIGQHDDIRWSVDTQQNAQPKHERSHVCGFEARLVGLLGRRFCLVKGLV